MRKTVAGILTFKTCSFNSKISLHIATIKNFLILLLKTTRLYFKGNFANDTYTITISNIDNV